MGSLHANFDQNRLNIKKFTKNRVLKQSAQKSLDRCKITRSTKWLSRNFEILSFWPPKFRKNEIFRKTFIKSKIFINLKNWNTYQRTSCLLPSCQILRKSINIWYPNRPNKFKNYAYQNPRIMKNLSLIIVEYI